MPDTITVDLGGAKLVQGPQGPAGPVFTPSISADGVVSWTNNGGLENPDPVSVKGDTGPQGPKGDKGDKGDTGATGPQGETGPQGATGATGAQGPKGDKGDKGDVGYVFTPSINSEGVVSWTNNGGLPNPEPVSVRGPQGVKGDTGDQGPQGERGLQGETGPQGPKGDKGDPGDQGIQGIQGPPGEQGEQGEPGEAAGFGQATATVDESTGTPSVDVTTSGPDTAKVFNFAFSGLKGETGAKGDKGDKGDTGATGPQGVSVIDAEINEAGHLVITLSAGEPIDAGNAVGPTGAKGDTGATGPEGASVSRIERTSGTGAPGTTDTYTVYLTDGSTGGTFQVYNGANGTGSGDFMADGSVPMTGALQMGGNKVTNLGAPGADTDAVRKQDLDAVAAEVDGILDGTTPAHLAPATETKIGGVIIGEGLSVEADGTVSAESQLPAGGTTGQILTQGANGPEWADAPDTGVTTFNGRTGAVTPQAGDYTAAMVGARGDDWTPTASDVGAATPADVNAVKPVLRTATLTTSGWSSNSQTVTVNGVVANSSAQLIYVSPANKDSATAWGEAGVFCSAQGANSLTFVCDSTPSANITVNISIQEAQT